MTATATPREVRLRSLPAYGFDEAQGAGVDRVNGVLRGVSAIQACEALGHGMSCDDVTLQQTADAINGAAGGIKVRFTHPGMCEDGTGKLLGKGTNARVAGGKVLFDVKLATAAKTSPKGNLFQHVIDLATESPTDVGFSIAAEGSAAWKLADGSETPAVGDDGPVARPATAVGDLPRFRLTRLRAVDLVDEPAANRDGLFSDTSSSLGEEAFHAIDRYLQQNGLTAERAHSFAQRYFAARGVIAAPLSPAGDSRPALPERDTMDKNALKALKAAHPDHAGLIVDMFADSKSEAEIVAAIKDAQTTALAAKVDSLTAKVAELGTQHAAALAAKDAQLAALQTKHDALAAIKATAPKDPGSSPESANAGEADPTDEKQLKAEWDRDPALRQNFFGDFSVFVAFRRDAPPLAREKAKTETTPKPAPGAVTE